MYPLHRLPAALLAALISLPAVAASAGEPSPGAKDPPVPETSASGDTNGDTAPDAAQQGSRGGNANMVRHLLRDGEYDPADVRPQPGANVGEITRCPVSGNVFVVTPDHAYIETPDGRIYVCCARCVQAYEQNPEAFR